jgi:hypothetical protein
MTATAGHAARGQRSVTHMYRPEMLIRLVQQLRKALPPSTQTDIAEPVERCISNLESIAQRSPIEEHQARRAWTLGQALLRTCQSLFPAH